MFYFSATLGRLSVQGGSPLTAGSPRICQIQFIYQIWLGRVHRNLQSAWEHLGEAEAAEEGGFVTGPRNSHFSATGKERQQCSSGHLWTLLLWIQHLHVPITAWIVRGKGTNKLFGTVINTVLKKEDNPTILTPTKQRNPDTQDDSIERQILSSFWVVIRFVN